MKLRSMALTIAITASSHGALSAQQDPFSLQGLIVTASPTARDAGEVASQVTIISAEELSRYGDRALSETLRMVPGLNVARSGSFGSTTSVFLRGGESDYTLVLVDGVQVNQAGGGFDFSTLSTDNVERIEVLRGPASALYGSDAVTGVINVITRTGRGPARADLTVRAGSFGNRNWIADFVAGTPRAGYSASIARRSGDGILAFNNQHVSTVLSGRARLLPDDRTQIDMSVRITDNEFHFPTDGSGVAVDRNAFTFSDAAQVRVSVSRALTRRLSVEAIAGLNEFDGGTEDMQDGPADTLGFFGFNSLDAFQRASAEVRAHLRLDGAVVTGGFEAERERQRSFTESASQFGPSNGRSGSERVNRAGFLHATRTVGAMSLTAGGRLEDNERFGQSATWQAGFSWLVPTTLDTRVRASTGSAIKEPTFFETFATGFAVGNPDLRPERSRAWDVGVEQPLAGGRVQVRATYFDQRFQDVIQYTSSPPNPGDPNYFNVAEATARGVETDVDLIVGPLTLGASHTWLDTEVADAGFDSGPGATFVEGESLLRRPGATWAVRAAASIGEAADVFARLSVVGERSDRDFASFPATPVVLPRYETLSLGADWTLPTASSALPELALTLLVDNLLDEEYDEVLGFRAPGRVLYVGGRVALGAAR